MSGAWRGFFNSVRIHVRVALRQRVSAFFTYVFPIGMLFMYLGVFYKDPSLIAFGMAPVLTMSIMSNSLFGLVFTLVQHRERGILRQYRLAPLSTGFVVLQNLLVGTVLAMPTLALQIVLAAAIYHFSLGPYWPAVLLLLALGILAFIGISSVIAAMASNMQQAHIFSNLIWLPFLFLSGVTLPLAMMPVFLKKLSLFLPPTYLVEGLIGLLTHAAPVITYGLNLLALVVTAALGTFVAARLFRWDKQDKLPWNRRIWSLLLLGPFALAGCVNLVEGRMLARMEKSWKQAASATDTTLLQNVTLIDGTGRAPEQASILIRGRTIKSIVHAGEALPKADVVRDLAGHWVIPGLIDVHVHIGASGGSGASPAEYTPQQFEKNLEGDLLCGVTTVRSLADSDEAVFDWRDRSARGDLVAPRILAAGPAFTATGGHPVELFSFSQELVAACTRQVDTPEAARAAVQALLLKKPDCIKAVYDGGAYFEGFPAMPKLKKECLAAIIDEAHKAGLHVTVHVMKAADVADVVELGTDGIEHGACDAPLPADLVVKIVQKHVAYDPTLAVLDGFRIREADPTLTSVTSDPLIRRAVAPAILTGLSNPMMRGLAAMMGRSGGKWNFKPLYKVAEANLIAVEKAGGNIALGTDAGNPLTFHGPAVHRSLALLVAAGLTPMRALQAATRDAADALGKLPEFGTVEAGKSADLVVLDADPLADIHNTAQIRAVYRSGAEVDLSALAAAIKR